MLIQAGFKPTASRTIINIINPALGTAADPIDAIVAVKIIKSWFEIVKSTICICAKKTTATAWYKLVPSILTVAPIGKTKFEIFFGIDKLLFTQSIVTGNVAALEDVENASIWAGAIDLKKFL